MEVEAEQDTPQVQHSREMVGMEVLAAAAAAAEET